MNMQYFNGTQRVRVNSDLSLANTELQNESGIVVNVDTIFVKVLMTSGNRIGQTHSFVRSQLTNLND